VAKSGQPGDATALAEEALATMQRASASDRYTAEAYNSLGSVNFLAFRFEEALAHWNRALALDGGNDPASRLRRGRLEFNVAMALDRLGRTGEALPIAEDGLADEIAGGEKPCPQLANTRSHIGWLLLRADRLQDAEGAVRRAIELCTDVEGAGVVMADAELVLVEVLSGQGRTDDALEVVRRARRTFERDPALIGRTVKSITLEASVLRRAGRLDQALSLIAAHGPTIARLDASHPEQLGLCFEHLFALRGLGRPAQAVEVISDCKRIAANTGAGPGSPVLVHLDAMEEELKAASD
jgi:tetratricopeptide (TPR) repeat protein